jgi:uncharacterized protein (TIGR00369 family)
MSDPTGSANRYGVTDQGTLGSLSGFEFLTRILQGVLPLPPICQTLGFGPVSVEMGRVVFAGTPDGRHYNPLGTVHGGYAATLLDSCMGCAIHSLLEAGVGYTTVDFKVTLLRPLSSGMGEVRAVGTVLNRGRRTAYAEGRLVDGRERLLAHGTTTCLLFPLAGAQG